MEELNDAVNNSNEINIEKLMEVTASNPPPKKQNRTRPIEEVTMAQFTEDENIMDMHVTSMQQREFPSPSDEEGENSELEELEDGELDLAESLNNNAMMVSKRGQPSAVSEIPATTELNPEDDQNKGDQPQSHSSKGDKQQSNGNL